MHGDLYRIAIHQRLDAFRLVSVCKLVGSVNINLYLASGSLLHQLAKLTTAVCPGRGFGCGAGKVPFHLRPVKVAVVADGVKGIVPVAAVGCLVIGSHLSRTSSRITGIRSVLCQRFWKRYRNCRNISYNSQNRYTRYQHRHHCFGNLLQSNLHSLFDLDSNCNEKVYTNRRCYLSDGKVYGCHHTKCHQVIAKGFAHRKHDRDKNVHCRVCVNKAACNQEYNVYDQQERKLVMCNACKKCGSSFRNTEFCADVREQGCTCHNEHNTSCGLCRFHKNIGQIF